MSKYKKKKKDEGDEKRQRTSQGPQKSVVADKLALDLIRQNKTAEMVVLKCLPEGISVP